jgi:pre-rRNA-processing protein TSR4
MACVELGFAVVPKDARLLRSRYFPSKIGGFPAWLDGTNLPSQRDVACAICKGPTVLLLQVSSDSSSALCDCVVCLYRYPSEAQCCDQRQGVPRHLVFKILYV